VLDRRNPPKDRPGFRWEWRDGCQCEFCFWKGFCLGETWPYWREVRVSLACDTTAPMIVRDND